MFKYFIAFVVSFALGFFINTLLQPDTSKPVEKTVTVTKVVTNPGVPETIRVFHDDSRGVTCYEGKQSPLLSCVPDTQLRPKL
jgi:hypothetical protein